MILVHYAAPRFVSVSSFDIFLRALLHARDISAPAAIHPRGEWTRGGRKVHVVHAWVLHACVGGIYTYFIIVVNRSGPCENKTRVIIHGILHSTGRSRCLNPVIVKFAYDSGGRGWMSRIEIRVEFISNQIYVCSQCVGSWLSYRWKFYFWIYIRIWWRFLNFFFF